MMTDRVASYATKDLVGASKTKKRRCSFSSCNFNDEPVYEVMEFEDEGDESRELEDGQEFEEFDDQEVPAETQRSHKRSVKAGTLLYLPYNFASDGLSPWLEELK